MKYTSLIFDNVEEYKININNGRIYIKFDEDIFTSTSLKHLTSNFKYILNYSNMNIDVILNLGVIKFADKITYLILESLIYYMITNTAYRFKLFFEINRSNIHSIGFIETALVKSIDKNNIIDKNKFLLLYEKTFYNNNNVYRRYLTNNMLVEKKEWPSIVASEIGTILTTICKDDEFVDSICEVTSELLCNVMSHTDGDCLIHIDNSDTIIKNNSLGKSYLSVNIAVINFSNFRLYDLIKSYIKENRYEGEDPLYKKIYGTYRKHKDFFNKEYNEDDFFLITAFQNHVTSRNLKSGVGGTGLTKMIEEITNKTEKDYSYVLSGNNVLLFKNEFLKLSEGKFVGFNEENDYFNYRPSKKSIDKSKLYIPGSIYNLLLIKEQE
ncbi:hypothetical protein FDA33_05790 [Clostridium botulinum]|nr:hypothetical protein [Clostridium botulinum]NFI17139.1 hypothetical protein [Clostridium botulinum]NFL92818.1 hypothetical protein [Clostridium botulinum]NFN51552.1 hypothetical protein [Clostridium botulinum]NFO27513.1 hypothetical protein [Clostridium botulinum]